MTAAIFLPGAQSLLPQSPLDPMSPDGINDVWRRQHYHHMSLPLEHYWPDSHAAHMVGMHDSDLSMFESESAEYNNTNSNNPFHNHAGPLISAQMAYVPDANWGSDMDMGTPSPAAFSADFVEGYQTLPTTSNPSQHLSPPVRYNRLHSPESSHSGISPRQSHTKPKVPPAVKEERPNLARSITAPAAPDQRPRRTAQVTSSDTPPLKRSGSEDEDDEFNPRGAETAKPRGRKRRRIPHTDVERRYRENLNAHLEKLRQTVPSLATKSTKSGDAADGMKPSKCEILTGAIAHIGALEKDRAALQAKVKELSSRLEDLERFAFNAAAPAHKWKCNTGPTTGFVRE